jgi:predicted lipoprotein with Yx(FWY)xxD motif
MRLDHRRTSTVICAAAAGLAATLLVSCSGGGSSASGAAVKVHIATVGSLGQVLVDSSGRTLYLFAPDRHSIVSCVQACAGNWPPVLVRPGDHPSSGGGLDASRLGSAASPDGGQVLTYYGWPLYRYAGDHVAGQARGHASTLSGGTWYALRANGLPA